MFSLPFLRGRPPHARRQSSSSSNTHRPRPVFAALPGSSAIIDAAQEAKITHLNELLDTLNEVFPSGDVEALRRLLATSSEESRLHVVTEMLLRSERMSMGARAGNEAGKIEDWQRFRSAKYVAAVKKLLTKEFKGLSKSTIQTVMVENNHDYVRTRTTLSEIASKSWRFSLTSLLFRRSTPSASASAAAANLPAHTGCEELDDELRLLQRPALEAKIHEQLDTDHGLAIKLNEEEHEAVSSLIECQCCFGDYAWESIVACSEGHFFCRECLLRGVQQGMYGQGRSLDGERVRCMSSTADGGCDAFVPKELLAEALPEDVQESLRERVASESLERAGCKLVRCPFCSYAEIDEIEPWKLSIWVYGFLAALSSLTGLFLPTLITFCSFAFATGYLLGLRDRFISVASTTSFFRSFKLRMEKAIHSIQLRKRGTRFRCSSPKCARESCISCTKEWGPFHKCYEKEEDAARVYVERAMADAVKRTCPKCSLSFIKSDGCNKLTCPCGYTMCYLCRADIGTIGYKHFCQHFRTIPGKACMVCDACDLYAKEDEKRAIEAAAKEAEREYWRRNKRPKGYVGPKRDFGAGESWWKRLFGLVKSGKSPGLFMDDAGVMDDLLEAVLEVVLK